MVTRPSLNDGYEAIPFRMHPRVFEAIGADLVTNDVVAVIELVKNSYDAFANNVWIRFEEDGPDGRFLEITDDGQGMTLNVIENVWCLVATPYRVAHPVVESESKVRRVAGEKGLGRLSVARLGDRLQMLTQACGSPCWEVQVDWSEISAGQDMSECVVRYRRYEGDSPFDESGTVLRISGLKSVWDDNERSDLEENLARLISPFAGAGDFRIRLIKPGETEDTAADIVSPEFLKRPKYRIAGTVDNEGTIECHYSYTPISREGGELRTRSLRITWEQVYQGIPSQSRLRFDMNRVHCGPFNFEIRAWDIGPQDTMEISQTFEFQKNKVRKAIRAHKGISVYRDGVLVLPKSDTGRDWLGLDLRRVSRVGTRLSTSQIVGYVSISADGNPKIEDTSDRERLVSTQEVWEFEELLNAIVEALGNERNVDRLEPGREKSFQDLFGALSPVTLLSDITGLANDGAQASETVPILRAFSDSLEAARKEIEHRFVYYSRLATIGTIAQMLVHEIRNRTTAIGAFLRSVKDRFGPFRDKDMEGTYRRADDAVDTLERLADTFSPLASRAFRRRKRGAVLEERIRECLGLLRGELRRNGIAYQVPDSNTEVAVDPGELDTILINLINNAAYWLTQVPKESRSIKFVVELADEGKSVRLWVHDSGPGLHEEDVEKVFWPGVTRKPGGIGMGLTVASELVQEYGGRMFVKHPGTMSGASFAFDLPAKP